MTRDPRPISEDALHFSIVQMLRLKLDPLVIFFHAANGEERHPLVGQKLEKMGVLPGVADIVLILQDGRAAFMEIKGTDSRGRPGKQSLVQEVFARRCGDVRARYAIVRSLDEAEAFLRVLGALRVREAA